MISKFPKIIAVVVFALVCVTWLFRGQTGSSGYVSHAGIQHLAERPQRPLAAAAKADRGTGRVHYADMPEPVNEDEPTSTSSFVPAPTTNPLFQRKTPFAYVFYATSDEYACSALVNIQRLKGFHTPHRIYALVTSEVSREYTQRMEEYNVTVSVTPPPPHPHAKHNSKEKSLLKLLAFKMHHIQRDLKRVIVLDADQYIYHPLDSLFALPSVDLAAPRAYWKGNHQISTTLMVISLSDRVWTKVEEGIKNLKETWYDTDLVQDLFEETVLMLPGQYAMIDQHFVDWDMPKWYRPEGDLHADGSIVEYSKAQLEDLWTALETNARNAPAADVKQHMSKPELAKLKKRDPPKVEHEDEDLGEVLTPEQVQKEKAAHNEEARRQAEEHKAPEAKHQEPPVTPGTPGSVQAAPAPPAEAKPAPIQHEVEEALEPERQKQKEAAEEAERQKKEAESLRQAAEAKRQQVEAQTARQEAAQQAAAPQRPAVQQPPPGQIPPKAVPAKTPPPPHPYTPQNHPDRGHLGVLHSQAVVYHFGAIYKPWQRDYDAFKKERPLLFPGMYESMRHWREASQNACPRQKKTLPPGRKGPNGETWEWFHFVHNV